MASSRGRDWATREMTELAERQPLMSERDRAWFLLDQLECGLFDDSLCWAEVRARKKVVRQLIRKLGGEEHGPIRREEVGGE